jgi:hypothetical protein
LRVGNGTDGTNGSDEGDWEWDYVDRLGPSVHGDRQAWLLEQLATVEREARLAGLELMPEPGVDLG